MKPITWMDSFYPKILNDKTFIPLDFKSALDVGCGKGTSGMLLRNFRNPNFIVGLDAFQPYLNHCNRFNHYDELYLHDLMNGKSLPFKDKSFDLVLCFEVIEHLDKANALYILNELKRIGKHVLVTTPPKFQPQTILDDNPWQIHKCVITKHDLQSKGFKVRGTGPIRFFGKYIPIESWRLGSLFPAQMQTLIGVFK